MLQYQILETGFFYADGGAMFGAIPKRAWSRKYPSDEQNCCLMAMRCILAWDQDRVILLDSGVGSKDLGKLSYYRFHDLRSITDLVRSCGFEPGQVTDVVLSHLHFDHCGGCTYSDENGKLSVTFPQARHWVSQKQWQSYLNPNYLETDSFRPTDMMLVEESGLIRLIDSDTELFKGFGIKIYDGHTDGQLASFIKTQSGLVVYPGDVIPTKPHLSTDWISAYDIHPLLSVDAKLNLLGQTAGNEGLLIFYHDAYNKSVSL